MEKQIYARIAALMGNTNIVPVVDVLYGMAPGSPALAYIPMFTRDFFVAKAAAEKLFDEVRWEKAEDGSYAGTFVKDDKAKEVVAATGPLLFCNAIIELYGLGMEITEDKPVKTIRQQKTK